MKAHQQGAVIDPFDGGVLRIDRGLWFLQTTVSTGPIFPHLGVYRQIQILKGVQWLGQIYRVPLFLWRGSSDTKGKSAPTNEHRSSLSGILSLLAESRWQIQVQATADPVKVADSLRRKSCFIVGTSIGDIELSDGQVFARYKGQGHAERGFRFLKDPVFFVSSLFIKKPSRIEGLLMVMTLTLLIYCVAQRRLRVALVESGQRLPNQIGQLTQRPTLRWVFQLLEGIHFLVFVGNDQVKTLIEGLTGIRRQILRLFGQEICQIYHISSP